ncbi:MAG TPA: AraC family transcriptional regulator [Gammaproteobacteria bacterium]|nr:AraC family transcriptional regulator [Gammaproteobacteria bacterium]
MYTMKLAKHRSMNDIMPKKNYHQNMLDTINFIHNNLHDPEIKHKALQNSTIPEHHWHRIYVSLSGETLAETIQRLKLSQAAHDLTYTNQSLKLITQQAGYDHINRFTRFFTDFYNMPPLTYRNKKQSIMKPSMTFHQGSYEVTILTTKSMKTVNRPHEGDYNNIIQSFEKLCLIAEQQGLLKPSSRQLCVFQDDPHSTPPEELRSKVCLSVPSKYSGCDSINSSSILGGRYATIVHKGPRRDIERTYQWLYGVWLPTSDEEPSEKPVIDRIFDKPFTNTPSRTINPYILTYKITF